MLDTGRPTRTTGGRSSRRLTGNDPRTVGRRYHLESRVCYEIQGDLHLESRVCSEIQASERFQDLHFKEAFSGIPTAYPGKRSGYGSWWYTSRGGKGFPPAHPGVRVLGRERGLERHHVRGASGQQASTQQENTASQREGPCTGEVPVRKKSRRELSESFLQRQVRVVR